MAIEVTCSGCKALLRVSEEHAGKQAKCPKCDTLNWITEEIAVEVDMVSPESPITSGSPFAESAAIGATPGAGPNPYKASAYSEPNARRYAPHRGGTILAMGIVSFVFNCFLIPGILAWVWGRGDLKQIDAGYMDPEGRGLTQAGMILGIISTCMVGIVLLIYIVIIFFAVAFAAVGAANGV